MAEFEVLAYRAKEVLSKIGWQLMVPSESFVNWDMATELAWDFADTNDVWFFEQGDGNRKELAKIYTDLIAYIYPMISEYVKEPWSEESNPVLVFDRAEWIIVSMENLKSLFSSLSQDYWEALESYTSLSYPIGKRIVKKASEVSITSELGFLVGYLSKKVLAQYDFGFPKGNSLMKGEYLYFIEPNIIALEQKFQLSSANLRLWIALHEVTHSFQFKAFPWLREYINSLLEEYMILVDNTIKAFKDDADEGRFAFSWSASLWKNLLNPQHREVIRKIQALMCLIEGYSEHVMMYVGRRFPNYKEMTRIFKAQRKRKTVAEQLLEKLIGFDLKVRQYALGEEFASHIVQKEGIDFLNRAWVRKENVPTWDEILWPDAWAKRMRAEQ